MACLHASPTGGDGDVDGGGDGEVDGGGGDGDADGGGDGDVDGGGESSTVGGVGMVCTPSHIGLCRLLFLCCERQMPSVALGFSSSKALKRRPFPVCNRVSLGGISQGVFCGHAVLDPA